MKIFITYVALVLVFGHTGAASQETDSVDTATPPRYVISIDRISVGDMQLRDTIAVNLESSGSLLAGFDLKVAIADPEVEVLEVLPGQLCDSCRWEFFHAAPALTAGTEGYPYSVWKIVAMAETIPDSIRPECYGLDGKVSIAKLLVSSGEGVQVPDTTIPIFFFWETCSDNTISDITGDTVAISTTVVDYYNLVLPESSELFPTHRGAPHQCIAPRARDRVLRQIEFHNGGVEFKVDLGVDSVVADTTGQ
jgi:hypothetical protein